MKQRFDLVWFVRYLSLYDVKAMTTMYEVNPTSFTKKKDVDNKKSDHILFSEERDSKTESTRFFSEAEDEDVKLRSVAAEYYQVRLIFLKKEMYYF